MSYSMIFATVVCVLSRTVFTNAHLNTENTSDNHFLLHFNGFYSILSFCPFLMPIVKAAQFTMQLVFKPIY